MSTELEELLAATYIDDTPHESDSGLDGRTDDRADLEAALDALIARLSQNGITQRSEAWHKDKADNIGGSSIATIMGLGYKRLGDFIREKAIPPPAPERAVDIEDTAAMNWGTVFEDVLCTYMEKQYNCVIKGTELYYRDYEKFPHLCYSPDGLGVFEVGVETHSMEVQTEDGVEYVTETIKRPTICLFEFKCPWTRIPTGTPPNYYVPQVKMGLQMLEGPTHGVFAEAVFRRCTLAQLGFGPEFDKSVSGRNGTPINRRTGWGLPPLACGILVFTGPALTQNVDLGTVPLNILKEVLYNAAKGVYEIDFELFLAGEEIAHVERRPALILPWKLFRVDVHVIEKDHEFLNPWRERIESTVRAIAAIRADPARADEVGALFAGNT